MYTCHLCDYSINIKGSFKTHLSSKKHLRAANENKEEDKKIRQQLNENSPVETIKKPTVKETKKVQTKNVNNVVHNEEKPKVIKLKNTEVTVETKKTSDAQNYKSLNTEKIKNNNPPNIMDNFNHTNYMPGVPLRNSECKPRFLRLSEHQELVDEEGLTPEQLQEEYKKYREERRRRHAEIDQIFDDQEFNMLDKDRADRLKLDYMSPATALRYGIKDYNPPIVGSRDLLVEGNYVCISRGYDGITNVDITPLEKSDKLMTPYELLEFLHITEDGEINQPLIDKIVSYDRFNKPPKKTQVNPFTHNKFPKAYDSDTDSDSD